MNRRTALTAFALLPWLLTSRRADALSLVNTGHLAPRLLTAIDAPLPPDATFVVALAGVTGPGASVPLPDEATLVRGSERIPLRLQLLAEGFGRLIPDAAPSAGSWRLVGLPEEIAIEIGGPRPLPIAPNVQAVTLVEASEDSLFERRPEHLARRPTACSLTFERDPSSAFLAVLAYYDGLTDDIAPAMVRFGDDPIRAHAHAVGDHTAWLVPPPSIFTGPLGDRSPRVGHRVAFQWIDRAGRTLPLSPPLISRR